MSDLTHCPKCGADQRATKIPQKNRCTDACGGTVQTCTDPDNHHYGKDSQWFFHTVGFYAHDVTLFYFCPFCNQAAWHRWPEGSGHRRSANIHMKREGFIDFTPKTQEV